MLLFSTGGCGGEGRSNERAVAMDLQQVQRALAQGKLGRVCETMTPSARRRMGLMAHGTPGRCPSDLREALRIIGRGGPWIAPRPARAASVSFEDDRATATLAGSQTAVPFRRIDERWHLDSFFGTPAPVAHQAARAIERSPFPGAADRPVDILDESGQPCFDAIADDFPSISGTCGYSAATGEVDVSVSTAFGRFKFGRCKLFQHVVASGDGRTWTTTFLLTSPVNNGCSDLRPCAGPDGEPLPWKGRIVETSAGRMIHRVDACLDTCVGFYVGQLVMPLAQRAGRRRTQRLGAVGASGLRFSGDLPIEGLAIKRR